MDEDPAVPHPVVALRVSSFCSDGNCVIVGLSRDDVVVADTKNAMTGPLRFTRAEWAAFVLGVKNGEFDLT